jgi:transketolase
MYDKRKEELIKNAAMKKAEQAKWESENPELATKLKAFFSKPKDIDYSKIEQKAGQATRAASAAVLAAYADQVENMIVSSADLSNSDKTDGFLKKTKAFQKGDFSGQFLQTGVSELTMGCIMNGLALHGGVIPVCGTFFVFSDYMKPAARMAALMELPVKYVWTHDAFRVGEDGPTHQPVEQEAQIRLLEKLQNHSHRNSMLVLRPADADETTIAWKMALENVNSPTALLLSRQGIKSVTTYETAQGAQKGAYIIKDTEGTPDVILLASGSEVSTLADGAELLEKDGIKCRIVSVPSEGLFRTQSADYQEAILPKGVKKFGMSAGLPVTLEGLVGADGVVFGLPSFGFSAPYNVLDEKLGFNGQNVYNQVKQLLG